jgi:hypothetical protein
MAQSLLPATRALALASWFLAIGGGLESSGAQACSGSGFLAATVAVTGLAVFDIATAPASVRRYNERRVSIAPYVNPRDRSYGLSVSWFYRKSTPVRLQPVSPLPGGSGDSVHSQKSPSTGFALSLLSTVAPMVVGVAAEQSTGNIFNGAGPPLILAGLVVGPSVGHFYAGQVVRGFSTAALRGIGTAFGIASIAGCQF